MRHFVLVLFILTLPLFAPGCTGGASKMAANQPRAHDLTVLKEGTLRHRVIAELGAPLHSEEKEGRQIDIFKFIDGYSTAARSSRSFIHGAMNIGTFGLWDIIGQPIEGGFSGKEVKIKVEYDEDDRVSFVKHFK